MWALGENVEDVNPNDWTDAYLYVYENFSPQLYQY